MKRVMKENEQLREELLAAYQKIESLKESIGCWRRRAAKHRPRLNGVIRQGFDQWRKVHYKVYVVNVPQDLDFTEVLKEIHLFLQNVKPYRFARLDYSKKYDGYLVQVEEVKGWDLNNGIFED